MDLKEAGGRMWTGCMWWVAVNMAMNLQAS
jgi:hypothetical protein